MAYSATSNSSGPLSTLKYLCERAGIEFKFEFSPSLLDPAGAHGASVFFKNSGKKLVRITDRSAVHYLELNETLCLGINTALTIPQVEALNNGI